LLGRHGRDPLTPESRGRSQQARPQGPSFQQLLVWTGQYLDIRWVVSPEGGIGVSVGTSPAGGLCGGPTRTSTASTRPASSTSVAASILDSPDDRVLDDLELEELVLEELVVDGLGARHHGEEQDRGDIRRYCGHRRHGDDRTASQRRVMSRRGYATATPVPHQTACGARAGASRRACCRTQPSRILTRPALRRHHAWLGCTSLVMKGSPVRVRASASPPIHVRRALRTSRSRARSSGLRRSMARENAGALIADACVERYSVSSSG
jgi:hypothetical protein